MMIPDIAFTGQMRLASRRSKMRTYRQHRQESAQGRAIFHRTAMKISRHTGHIISHGRHELAISAKTNLIERLMRGRARDERSLGAGPRRHLTMPAFFSPTTHRRFH